MGNPLDADFYRVAKEADYNLEATCKKIKEYYEDKTEAKLLAAVNKLLPLVNKVIRERFPWIPDSDMEDITSTAVMKYWKLLKREKIPISYPRTTNSFLLVTTKRIILDTRRSLQRTGYELDTTDLRRIKQIFGPKNRTHKVTWLADVSMFIDSFPKVIAKRMEEENRFPDVTPAVIEYFAVRALAGETVAEETFIKGFGFSNPTFYISYLTVLYRMSLYELREHELVTCRENEGGFGYRSSYDKVDALEEGI